MLSVETNRKTSAQVVVTPRGKGRWTWNSIDLIHGRRTGSFSRAGHASVEFENYMRIGGWPVHGRYAPARRSRTRRSRACRATRLRTRAARPDGALAGAAGMSHEQVRRLITAQRVRVAATDPARPPDRRGDSVCVLGGGARRRRTLPARLLAVDDVELLSLAECLAESGDAARFRDAIRKTQSHIGS